MKIDVREQRTDDTPLRGASFTGSKSSIFLYPRYEEAFDVTQDAFISNTVTQKVHQVVLVYVVEEATYVGFNDVVDLSAFDG